MTTKKTDQAKWLGQRVGANMRNIRLKRGIALSAAAQHVDKSKSSVSFWELGRNEAPYTALKRLSELYSCQIGDFFNTEIEPNAYRTKIRSDSGKKRDSAGRIILSGGNPALADHTESGTGEGNVAAVDDTTGSDNGGKSRSGKSSDKQEVSAAA